MEAVQLGPRLREAWKDDLKAGDRHPAKDSSGLYVQLEQTTWHSRLSLLKSCLRET